MLMLCNISCLTFDMLMLCNISWIDDCKKLRSCRWTFIRLRYFSKRWMSCHVIGAIANVLTWILGVALKQLRLLHGRVGDSTIVVNSLSPQMSELVEDAIASWCGDIVMHFWLIRNGVEKLVELKFEFFSFNTFDVSQIFRQRVVQPRPKYSCCILLKGCCAGFLFVGYWITHCVPCLGCFLVFIVSPIVPSIFGTICCVIFQTYTII